MKINGKELETLQQIMCSMPATWARSDLSRLIKLSQMEWLPNEVSEIMNDAGCNQKQFAEKIGVSPQYLSDFLKGRRAFTRKQHDAIEVIARGDL